MPSISVIMPAYNAAETIDASIRSVIDQTFNDWELIIIDDASTDNTALLATEYEAKDSRIKLLSLTQNGWLANARNQGIALAKGEYLAFLDSDDMWTADKLAQQIDFHQKNPEIVISHTDFEMFSADGIKKRPFKNLIGLSYKKDGDMIPSIYCRNAIGILSVVAKRDAVIAAGAFSSSIRVLEDHDLWIRLAENGARFGYIDKKLAFYRLSSGGITHKIGKYKRTYKNLLKKHRERAEYHNVYNLALANYYRYFGQFYAGKKQYQLAKLYLCAAMKNERYLLDRSITFGFYMLCLAKYSLSRLKK